MRPTDILAAGSGSPVGPAILGILIFFAYWTPSLLAMGRHVRNTGSVIIVNAFLGWTVIGWIVALAMACRSKDAAVQPTAGGGAAP
jgi:hypothetical protein